MRSIEINLQELLTVAAAVVDPTGRLIQANPGFLRLLPAGGSQSIGTNVISCFIQPDFAALLATSATRVGDAARRIMTIGDYAGKSRTLLGRVWRSAEGIRVLAEYDIAELERLSDAMLDLNQESAVAQYNLLQANASLRTREVEILESSLTDALTGVGNRRKLEESLKQAVGRAQHGGGELSTAMVDIDHFKLINDEYGHAVGDKVLTHIAALLRSQTRSSDLVARFGGEEFVLLLPGTKLAQAVAKAELLRSALAHEGIPFLRKPVTASFGVAELANEEQGDALLMRADAAMYEAKAAGRNRVVASRASSAGAADLDP